MNSIQLTERFEVALVFATRLHANQVRKVGGTPYIAHLLSVAALVLEDGGSEEEAIAALLHDAVEDQGGVPTRTLIYAQFGEEVGAIVDGCTEVSGSPKPPWKERKLRYLEQLRQSSPAVLRVSMADKLHNLRSLLIDWYRYGDQMWHSFNGSPQEKLWFYDSLLQVYAELAESRMIKDLDRAVAELHDRIQHGD